MTYDVVRHIGIIRCPTSNLRCRRLARIKMTYWGTDLVLGHHSIHVTHTQYLFPQSFDTKQHPQKYFSKHGICQYVLVCTRYILVYTCWTSCTLSGEGVSILILGYHHTLVPHTQYHFPQVEVKQMSVRTVSWKLCLDQYIPVCAYVQVHKHTDHTHTSFPIRRRDYHPCCLHEFFSDVYPTLCGQAPAYLKSPHWQLSSHPGEACHARTATGTC